MATIDELYADLCETKESAEEESKRSMPEGADMTSALVTGVPWIVTKVGGTIARQFREYSCSHKDVIRAAVDKFLATYVPDGAVAGMIRVALDVAEHAACGSSNQLDI